MRVDERSRRAKIAREWGHAALLAVVLSCLAGVATARPLRVVATLPGLGDLVRQVGGDEVDVDLLVRGTEDPHFVEARPSFIRLLSRADLFVHTGLSLEIGWVPPLVRNARNAKVLPGGSGDFDASLGVPLLEVASGAVDRSQGDVHPDGNPHYLLDPVAGLRVARRLRDVLRRLRPGAGPHFEERYDDFEARLVGRLVGDALVGLRGSRPLADALFAGEPFESLQPDTGPVTLGGWLAAMKPHRGRTVVADHNLWPYFTQRFGLRVAGFLEPVPGITPTTSHLSKLAVRMKSEGISTILSAAYFHPRYAAKLAKASGASVVEMANQVGARPGVEDYLAMIDWNVRAVADAP